jgi:hypothetical protein
VINKASKLTRLNPLQSQRRLLATLFNTGWGETVNNVLHLPNVLFCLPFPLQISPISSSSYGKKFVGQLQNAP